MKPLFLLLLAMMIGCTPTSTTIYLQQDQHILISDGSKETLSVSTIHRSDPVIPTDAHSEAPREPLTCPDPPPRSIYRMPTLPPTPQLSSLEDLDGEDAQEKMFEYMRQMIDHDRTVRLILQGTYQDYLDDVLITQ